jgi:hypothetical protein
VSAQEDYAKAMEQLSAAQQEAAAAQADAAAKASALAEHQKQADASMRAVAADKRQSGMVAKERDALKQQLAEAQVCGVACCVQTVNKLRCCVPNVQAQG